MKVVHIYLLVDPRNNEVHYVGQALNPLARWKGHCCKVRPRTGFASKYANWALINWVRDLHAVGLQPTLMVIGFANWYDRAEEERFYIEYFRFIGANLFNRVGLVSMRFRHRKSI